jgi:hypothetical protein
MNSVVGSNIIYVPASVPINTPAVHDHGGHRFQPAVPYAVHRDQRSDQEEHHRPIENFVKVADQVSKSKFDNKFEVDTEDELRRSPIRSPGSKRAS